MGSGLIKQIKLSNGEYLALDKVESIYKATDVVMMLCIAAPPYADRPVALVYPVSALRRRFFFARTMLICSTRAICVISSKR